MTAEPPAARRPLLDLATLDPLERPFVKIDGVEYDLAVPADFGLLTFNRIDTLAKRIDGIQKVAARGPLTDAQGEELAKVLDDEVAMVLRAPDEVRAKLTDAQKLGIVRAFGQASRRASTPGTKPNRETRRRTGARSSRVSPASTRASATG